MNRRGFSLIELLSVLVILSVIVLIASPNVVKLIDNSKKSNYIAQVKDFVSKATYMYKLDKYRNDSAYFTKVDDNTYIISLGKIEGIDDYTDAFGYTFDKDNTVITFIEGDNPTELKKRVIKVKALSCNTENDGNAVDCYEINDVVSDELDVKSIKSVTH